MKDDFLAGVAFGVGMVVMLTVILRAGSRAPLMTPAPVVTPWWVELQIPWEKAAKTMNDFWKARYKELAEGR